MELLCERCNSKEEMSQEGIYYICLDCGFNTTGDPFPKRLLPETEVEVALIKARWPEGVICIRCNGHVIIAKYKSQRYLTYYQCSYCSYSFTVKVGTMMHGSKAYPEQWYNTCKVLIKDRAVSANELAYKVGLSYSSNGGSASNNLRQKILEVLAPGDDDPVQILIRPH